MKKTLLTLTAIMLICASAYAQPEAMVASPRPWTVERAYYTDSPMSKGSDGFINATTSWADIPAEVAQTTADQNLLAGVTLGLGKGIASSVTRGAAGVVDMATFMFPPYDEPLVEPEYAVDQPQKEGYKVDLFKW